MKVSFKKLKNNYFVVILILVVLTATMSCTSESPFGPGKGIVTAQLASHPAGYNFDLEEFILSYSEWELEFIDFYYAPSLIINFSFNNKLISDAKFIEILRKDPIVVRAEFKPFKNWLSGRIVAKLKDDIKDNELDDLLISFSEYELEVIIHDKKRSMIKFSFNHKLINEFEFHEKLNNDDRVVWVSFSYPFPEWVQGRVQVQLYEHVVDDAFQEFLSTYSMYEFRVLSPAPGKNCFHFYFNPKLINDFDFLELLENDDRVIWADFDYYPTVSLSFLYSMEIILEV